MQKTKTRLVAKVKLLHSVPTSEAELIKWEGLKASSAFDDLGLAMRRKVVYCWLRHEDDKMWGQNPAYTHIELTVDISRCRVAEMDFASLAMMYLQGQAGRPKNTEVAALLARVYQLTSVPLNEYRQGMFSTPEVLVKGDVFPEHIGIVAISD